MPLQTVRVLSQFAAHPFHLLQYQACMMHKGLPDRLQPWLPPVVGVVTGLVTSATGVFVIPAVPYLQGLDLGKEYLVQALGLAFTRSPLLRWQQAWP
jgi:uncharacterized membrane protein YfcA